MAFSNAAVLNQVQDIRRYVRGFDGCDVVDHRVTNKRMIVCCTGRNVANAFAHNLMRKGYPNVQAAAGIKTAAYYVEVRFNYPY